MQGKLRLLKISLSISPIFLWKRRFANLIPSRFQMFATSVMTVSSSRRTSTSSTRGSRSTCGNAFSALPALDYAARAIAK